MKIRGLTAAATVLAATLAAAPAAAESDWPFGLQLEGSFGEGGFRRDRYVPPVSHFVLNETPFITTELRPIYAHHEIPGDFVTGGGDIDAVALQGRLALTDRLAIIATTDGWADVDFNRTLEDADGFLDIAAGVKYAFYVDPKEGAIVTAGLRYTAPTGSLNTGSIELTGEGNGYVDAFVTGAKTWLSVQLQGSAGVQAALSNDNWSYVHLGTHANYRLTRDFFPFIETNVILPIDGGDEFPKGTPVLENLAGGDIVDIGAPDPDPIATIAMGARYRLTDNLLFGAAFEASAIDNDNTLFGWRITTDLIAHF